ncbi:MAG: PaaI family thioesterase [Solirubrobacterales bacterium]
MNQTYDDVVAAVLGLPLHKYVGIELIDSSDPARGVAVDVSESNVNPSDNLHGGVVPLLLDVAAYLAAAELFEPETDAVTATNSVSLLRPVPMGKRFTASASVDRLGRNALFITARAECEGQIVATAQIVKAVVSSELPRETDDEADTLQAIQPT